MDLLTLSHVSKSFGPHTVIDGLSFSVPEHTIFGFIGQNGAGKTTTMKMILGLLQPDKGEIYVNGSRVCSGHNPADASIGYLQDVPEFYDFMTPAEYLDLCGRIANMPKDMRRDETARLLRLVGLAHADKRIRGFSRGMKQRLGIAQALLNNPKLLVCDEPASALDPLGRREILDILTSIKTDTTVILSTHILSDLEQICDEAAFLHQGRIALQGTLKEIKDMHKGSGLEIEFCCPSDADSFAEIYPGAERHGCAALQYRRKTDKDMLHIMQVLVRHDIPVQRIELLEAGLEDLFMEVIRKWDN